MNFAFQALRDSGEVISDSIDAGSAADALDALRGRGLMVTRLTPTAPVAAAAADAIAKPSLALRGGYGKDLFLFTRQMKMLLESGAPLMSALEAVEQQAGSAGFRSVVQQIKQHVERGGTLADAVRERPDVFRPVFSTTVAAGEATASLGAAFSRLSDLAAQQQQLRRILIAALAYPLILGGLSIATIAVLIGFVVPRFKTLFESLRTPLPFTTQIALAASDWLVQGWPLLVALVVLPTSGLVVAYRQPAARDALDELLLRLPVIGRLMRRLILGRILRVWAVMLRSHVPLLDTIAQSRNVTANYGFRKAIDAIEQSVQSGGRIGRTLALSGLVEPIVAAAISTGEEHGRLTESVEFVSGWLDEDNTHAISTLTRMAEPLFLGVMGLVVGMIAAALFIPLFDLATAGGGG